jgi:hypothetical protein
MHGNTLVVHDPLLYVPVAAADDDYITISEAVTFSAGSQDGDIECVDIFIVDDGALERNETFTLILTTSDPDVMLGNNVTTITIIDNEGNRS